MIGSTLQNRYRIEAELGQGGMGTVYRAADTLLDRPVALKVLSSTGLDTEGRVRLLREARAAARLNHPNIMAIYDAGEAGGMSFIVMELLTGRTLREYPAEYHRQPAAPTSYLAFDATRAPFNDARVRRALAQAIDRHELTQGLLLGVSSPALGGLVPPGLPGHAAHIGLIYDPARAQQLLAEAGYPGGRDFPEIEAYVADGGETTRVTNQYLKDQWREQLGLRVNWHTLDFLTFQATLRTSTPQLYLMAWIADYPDPDNLLRLALHQPYSRWHNDRFDQLLESARRLTDPAERLKFYQAADRLLMDEAGVIPLTYERNHALLKPWVKRFPSSPIKTTYFKDIVIEPH